MENPNKTQTTLVIVVLKQSKDSGTMTSLRYRFSDKAGPVVPCTVALPVKTHKEQESLLQYVPTSFDLTNLVFSLLLMCFVKNYFVFRELFCKRFLCFVKLHLCLLKCLKVG